MVRIQANRKAREAQALQYRDQRVGSERCICSLLVALPLRNSHPSAHISIAAPDAHLRKGNTLPQHTLILKLLLHTACNKKERPASGQSLQRVISLFLPAISCSIRRYHNLQYHPIAYALSSMVCTCHRCKAEYIPHTTPELS